MHARRRDGFLPATSTQAPYASIVRLSKVAAEEAARQLPLTSAKELTNIKRPIKAIISLKEILFVVGNGTILKFSTARERNHVTLTLPRCLGKSRGIPAGKLLK